MNTTLGLVFNQLTSNTPILAVNIPQIFIVTILFALYIAIVFDYSNINQKKARW